MSAARFKPGTVVEFSPAQQRVAPGVYEVVRQMPSDAVEPAYRVRSQEDGRERIAAEHELRPLRASKAPAPFGNRR